MATQMPYFKPRIQKWFSSIGVVSSACIPMLLAYSIGIIPLYTALILQVGSFAFHLVFQYFAQIIPFQKFLDESENRNNSNQYHYELLQVLSKRLDKLAAKQKIPAPNLIILKNVNKTSPASACSAPFKSCIGILEQHLEWLATKCPDNICNAILAHELSHVANHDSLLNFFCNTFNSSIRCQYYLSIIKFFMVGAFSLLLMALHYLGGAHVNLLFEPLSLVGILGLYCVVSLLSSLLNEQFFNALNKALEYLADENAAKLTADPLGTSLVTYEIVLHAICSDEHLLKNNLVKSTTKGESYNDVINEAHTKFNLPKGLIFRQAFKILQKNKLINRSADINSTESDSHPSNNQRYKALKTAYPSAFKNVPKLFMAPRKT